jgi:hypothetical protein
MPAEGIAFRKGVSNSTRPGQCPADTTTQGEVMRTLPKGTGAALDQSDPVPGDVDSAGLDEMLDQTLHTRDDSWIQAVGSDSEDLSGEIYLSTFHEGNGQQLITLTPREARLLGERLIDLSREAVRRRQRSVA